MMRCKMFESERDKRTNEREWEREEDTSPFHAFRPTQLTPVFLVFVLLSSRLDFLSCHDRPCGVSFSFSDLFLHRVLESIQEIIKMSCVSDCIQWLLYIFNFIFAVSNFSFISEQGSIRSPSSVLSIELLNPRDPKGALAEFQTFFILIVTFKT